MDTGSRPSPARVMGLVNATLLVALMLLIFEPMRSNLAEPHGLWRICRPPSFDVTGFERWSPRLLVVLAPFLIWGAVAALRAGDGRQRRFTGLVTIGLATLALALVLVPTASCIA